MKTGEVLKRLREKSGYTQEELAEKVFVTRQAISRWENGDTEPNIESLKRLSVLFNVSIHTILGDTRELECQCCGMPLEEDGMISREVDNSFNEDYCKWCYQGGKFTYESKEELLAYLVRQFSDPSIAQEKVYEYFDDKLSALNHWNSKP
ncbi:MAG: zinc ribbon domain-containing protein [Tissierellia bacterium]|nr:zinc ribbon domain-containing protein [Tissierellia bacterium]